MGCRAILSFERAKGEKNLNWPGVQRWVARWIRWKGRRYEGKETRKETTRVATEPKKRPQTILYSCLFGPRIHQPDWDLRLFATILCTVLYDLLYCTVCI